MTRIAIIKVNSCIECPHYDNSYWGYNEICTLLGRKTSPKNLPDDCPLTPEKQLSN